MYRIFTYSKLLAHEDFISETELVHYLHNILNFKFEQIDKIVNNLNNIFFESQYVDTDDILIINLSGKAQLIETFTLLSKHTTNISSAVLSSIRADSIKNILNV